MFKILLLHFRTFGDHILATPFYRAVREHFPEARISIACLKECEGLVNTMPYFQETIPLSKQDSWLTNLRRLRKVRYDIVVNLEAYDRGFLFGALSRSKLKITKRVSSGLGWLGKLYHREIENEKKHIVLQNLDLLQALSIDPGSVEKELMIEVFSHAKQKVNDLVRFDQYILIHPASRCSVKHWTVSGWQALIKELLRRGQNVVLSGGPGSEEQAYLQKIIAPISSDHFQDLSGKFTLTEMSALVEGAKQLIGVDTVVPHMAAALRVPTLVLFGPTDMAVWGPWNNPNAKVLQANLEKLSAKEVMDALFLRGA